MEILEEIIDRISTTFSFLINVGYTLEPVEIDNEDNPELISATLIFTNIQANRSVFIDVNMRKEIRLPITIQKIAPKENLPLVDYIAFQNGQRPHYNPPFILERDNFADSIDQVTMIVRNLFETSLKEVVEGKEWITIPSYDPRDQANYH